MGVGLSIAADLPKSGRRSRALLTAELFGKLEHEAKQLLPIELQPCVFAAAVEADTLFLRLHPAEEPAAFKADGKTLACSAKTSSAGPGYHAFLVDLLETIGEKTGLAWRWTDDSGNPGDETGFHEHRDFPRLQAEMLRWFHALANNVIGNNQYDHLLLSLPLGYSILGDFYTASPLGYWSRGWLQNAARSGLAELKTVGAEFFPWWEAGCGPEFWLKCGLAKAWVDLPWHAALNKAERDDYRFVLACFARAKAMDERIVLPEDAIGEINRCLAGAEPDRPPSASGIGFKRRLMARPLTGNWTAAIPGYFYSGEEDSGSTARYWFGGKTVRGTSFTVERKDGRPSRAAELSLDRPPEPDVMEWADENRAGWAYVKRAEENGRGFWCLQGKMAVKNNLCYVTVCFEADQDREWAVETWRSVALPEPR